MDEQVEDLVREAAEVQAAQRADTRADSEAEVDREDRERRSHIPATCASFVVGSMVSHDLLGDATVSKPARERDGYLNIEWTRTTGKGAKKQVKVQNRWVLPSTLHKIGIEVRKEQPIQQGIFGNMPNLAAHERERGREGGAGGRRPAGGESRDLNKK